MKAVQSSRAPFLGVPVRKAARNALLSTAMLAFTSSTFAGAELKLSDDAAINLGLGLRTSYTSATRAAPNGTSRSNDFNVENARIFMSGNYGKVVKATLNVQGTAGTPSGGDTFKLLDGIVQFEFMPELNVWMGRLLPPQDRANGYGPFYALPWSYPGTISNYPQIFNGRDNGVMVWGKPLGGKLTYSLGAFEGHNKARGYSGESDKLAYSGRFVVHLLEPEPAPAHLAGGWFGGKDLLSIGIAGYSQADGVGIVGRSGKLTIWNADILFEKKLSIGVPTLELAYYQYKLGALDCGSGEPGAPVCPAGNPANSGGMADGKAYLIGAGYLIPQQVGWGQFQPFVRYQKFDRSASNTSSKTTDIGVNYVIKGPNAKVTAMYSKFDDNRNLTVGARQNNNQFTLGVQLQY